MRSRTNHEHFASLKPYERPGKGQDRAYDEWRAAQDAAATAAVVTEPAATNGHKKLLTADDLYGHFIRKKPAEREPGDEPVEPQHVQQNAIPSVDDSRSSQSTKTDWKPERFSFLTLKKMHPNLHPPIIDGLLREREILNLISVSKIGKSWMLYGLLLSIVTGRDWLDRFPTSRGRVLLIDNELHPATLVFRIKAVADAMGIPEQEYAADFQIMCLRGNLIDISRIAHELRNEKKRDLKLIALDAKYRATSAGISENDNTGETLFYNEADKICKACSGFMTTHHSSKGGQGEKRVTDVGAGAGAQSRAADCHLILREHEESDAVVLDAAIRNFAPIEPMVLRWNFPLWVPDSDADATLLKGKKSAGEERQSARDTETDNEILDCCQTWKSRNEIRTATGFGNDRRDRGIARLLKAKLLEESKQDINRNPNTEVFRKTIHAR